MKSRRALLVGVAVFAVGAAVAASAVSLFERPELASMDARLKIRGERAVPDDIAIVAIDAKTLSDLQRRFPFPRSVHARLIEDLTRAGARVIGYDVEFAQPTSPPQDRRLLRAIERAHSIVLETTKLTAPGRPAVVFGYRRLRAAGVQVGAAIVSVERDGEIRRVDYSLQGIPSFPILVADAAAVRKGHLQSGGAPFWIDYRGDPGSFPTFSFSDVLGGRVAADAFRDKIVLVGATDPAQHDLHTTPPAGRQMSGVEIWANAIATALDGFPLRTAPAPVDLALLLLLGSLCPLLALRVSVGRAVLMSAVAIGLLAVGVQLAFDRGLIVQFVYPTFAGLLGILGTAAVETATSTRERRRARGILSRYMDPAIASLALDSTGDDARLPSEEVEATVLFCDLRGFTNFAATRTPLAVVEMQNEYLTQVSAAIQARQGTIISFLGDGVMAVFGAPVESPNHAADALAAAREIAEVSLPRLNAWLEASGSEGSFEIGIGLATGRIVSGSIGSGWRLEYTATGDATNLAARLQELTKSIDGPILVSHATWLALQADAREGLASAGHFTTTDRRESLRIWTVT